MLRGSYGGGGSVRVRAWRRRYYIGNRLAGTALGSGNKLTGEQQADLRAVLQAHYGVFQEREGLPRSREMEHRITLKEGVNPVNIRPYRYPYLMKEEIEKQVADMLKAGIIRPSKSSYSSPVILVKKKNGSWRFCVDYQP
ncbi:hypothetical protein LR48_Vigan03g241300 [Vigna angularis]|uniref:Reverse transcriptase domain-containing protein n=1 Tax=Phaseolus angularis TaxID=3914 RepID=A0A0L9U8I2_PHAAN|nr:hypothetical protein LR48_Vigan03g241300 [Vigna angularis]